MKNLLIKVLGRDILGKIFKQNQKLLMQNQELEWAHIYHDSIKGKPWLDELSLNIGRWAGNYSFFYVLNRILSDCKPKNILEFGLGESSKVISKYIEYYLEDSTHEIIEHDRDWKNHFNNNFSLTRKSVIHILPLKEREIKGFKYSSYSDLKNFIDKKYDFYLVDGPFGSPKYSRYDIVDIAKNMNNNEEFIILLDDYDRLGEQDTFDELLGVFAQNSIKVYTNIYSGTKSVGVIGTEKYKFVRSL